MSKVAELLGNIVKIATRCEKIDRVVLYGSRARGDAAERSDIDIAIDAPGISVSDWSKILDSLDELNTLLEIDVVEFNSAGKKLQARILSEGKVLYERSKN